jgi:hypothetical protein
MGRSVIVNQAIKAEDPGAFHRMRGRMARAMRRVAAPMEVLMPVSAGRRRIVALQYTV